MTKQEYIMLMKITQNELFSEKSVGSVVIAIQNKIRDYFYETNRVLEWPTEEEIKYIYSSEEDLQ